MVAVKKIPTIGIILTNLMIWTIGIIWIQSLIQTKGIIWYQLNDLDNSDNMVPIEILLKKSNYLDPAPNRQMIQNIVIIEYRSDDLDYSDNTVPVKRIGQ